MLADSLRLFMVIELQLCPAAINIVVYSSTGCEVDDFEVFKWQNEKEKLKAIQLAIRWLMEKAIGSEFLMSIENNISDLQQTIKEEEDGLHPIFDQQSA